MSETIPDFKECGPCPQCGAQKARCVDLNGITGLECEECLFSASAVDWHHPVSGYIPPASINGTPVYQSGGVLLHWGNRWVPLVPDNAKDERIWEFSLTTGKLVRTR